VPIDHFEHMMEGSELFTGYALDGLGQAPNDDEISSMPDVERMIQLPWQPDIAWLPADNYFHGEPYPLNTRVALKRVLAEAAALGFGMNLGIECEIYVLKLVDGRFVVPDPTDTLTKPCYDLRAFLRSFPFLDRMVTLMNELGWDVYSFDHEDGNGQFEFDFRHADALTMCDRYVFWRYMVKHVAAEFGLVATFMPKPFGDKTGNGAHFNMSLADLRSGANLFAAGRGEDAGRLGLSPLGYHYVGGLLRHGRALCAVLAPTVNSYKRLIRRGGRAGHPGREDPNQQGIKEAARQMIRRALMLALALVATAGTVLAKEPLKVGYSDWPGFTAWEIAKVKGLFKKNGVDVDLVWFPVYTDSLTALNTGQLDCNLQTWSDTMAPLAEGIPLKAVLLLDNSYGNDAMVAKPGIASPKDLKGKTIATELGTCDHFLMLKALASAGLTEKDVTYTNLTVPDAAAAFIAGKVDAAVIWQPWVSQIQREGTGKVVYSSADIPGLIPDLAVCRTSVVEQRPKDIQNLVNTWFDIIAFLKANQDEAVAIMAKVVEQPPDAYKAFMPGTRFFDLPMNLKSFEKRPNDDSSLAGSGKTISEFLVSVGQIKKVPDYDAAIDPKFIKAVKQ
jgi:aliphatic sulfonates family ABC transporter substrate-binding protein